MKNNIFGNVFGEVLEISRRVEFNKIWILSINEGDFGKFCFYLSVHF